MNQEYSNLKALYRQARIASALTTEKFNEDGRSAQISRQLTDFCAANGIDRKDLQTFLAQIDQEIVAKLAK
jgi:hypothetical protein